MKSLATILLFFATFVLQAQNTNRVHPNEKLALPEGFQAWHLLNGVKFTAKPIDFNGTNAVTFYYTNGQKGILAITNLTKDDVTKLIELRPFIIETKEKRWLEAKKNELENEGRVEFTVSQLKNFPERIQNKKVYAVATFDKIDSFGIENDFNREHKMLSRISGDEPGDDRTNFLGFIIVDSQGERFGYCCGDKERDAPILLNLKSGQKIIVVGLMGNITGKQDWLFLNSIVTFPDAINNRK